MATNFKRSVSNTVIKRLIKEREAKGLTGRAQSSTPPRPGQGTKNKPSALENARKGLERLRSRR